MKMFTTKVRLISIGFCCSVNGALLRNYTQYYNIMRKEPNISSRFTITQPYPNFVNRKFHLAVDCLCKPNQKLASYFKNINFQDLCLKLNLHDDNFLIQLFKEKDEIEENLKQLHLLKTNEDSNENKEMLELIEEDIQQYAVKLNDVFNKIIDLVIPRGDFDNCNDIVLEISAGVGGLEAMLFSGELRDMYCGFLDYKGWKYCLAENDKSEIGGVRHCSLLVSGPGAYRALQHEAGVHRVQRIPVTERGSRMHTSTVSVAILPQPTDIEVNLKDSDLKIETKRAGGAGGQHVNTTDSAVRVVHLPTGIVVECQSGRSQIQNKLTALKRLQAKIYERELSQMDSSIRTHRKLQIGTSSRSEKIRTYNYRDDRISDHRLSLNVHNLREFMQGGESLDKLLTQLQRWHYDLQVRQFIETSPS